MSATHNRQDVFGMAREKLSIAEIWESLGLPGTPKPSCKSPFRDEKSPSFSIHSDGKAWNDHGTGEGGDVIDFVMHALSLDHRGAREWFAARLGLSTEGPSSPTRPAKALEPQKAISWPAEIIEGSKATWEAFASLRGFTFPATHTMVKAGTLRFLKLPDGSKCYVVTDETRRAAEIRRVDGNLFGSSKAFPLPGVDKSWLPGAELLRGEPRQVSVLITEGATDLLSAIDLYSRYKRDHAGRCSWIPIALLGAKCRNLHLEASDLLRGRHVRIVPDGDASGDGMADHWSTLLRKIGCTVDIVSLPRETDLTDHLKTLSPEGLFAR